MLRLQSEEHLLFQSNNSDKLKTKPAPTLKHDVRCLAIVLLHHMEAEQRSMKEIHGNLIRELALLHL